MAPKATRARARGILCTGPPRLGQADKLTAAAITTILAPARRRRGRLYVSSVAPSTRRRRRGTLVHEVRALVAFYDRHGTGSSGEAMAWSTSRICRYRHADDHHVLDVLARQPFIVAEPGTLPGLFGEDVGWPNIRPCRVLAPIAPRIEPRN